MSEVNEAAMPCRRATSTSWEMIPEYFVLIASWSAVSLASTSLWVAAAVSASLVFCFSFRLAISHRTRKIGASAN